MLFVVVAFVHVSDGLADLDNNYLISPLVYLFYTNILIIEYSAHKWSTADVNKTVELDVYAVTPAGYVRTDVVLLNRSMQLQIQQQQVGIIGWTSEAVQPCRCRQLCIVFGGIVISSMYLRSTLCLINYCGHHSV